MTDMAITQNDHVNKSTLNSGLSKRQRNLSITVNIRTSSETTKYWNDKSPERKLVIGSCKL